MPPFMTAAIDIHGLDFHYPGDERAVLHDIRLTVPRGARCLLVGANGAGKSTLLFVLAGRYLIDPEKVRVLGCPAFHDTTLTARRAFLGGTFPFDVDIKVRDILARHTEVDLGRQARLVQILDVNLDWRMHRVSDGQRRRVQILLGLLKPSELLLLDEVTTDLDVIARADLLAFLREESETRGLTILYATHIFDGLEAWASHLAHVAHGRLKSMASLGEIAELRALQAAQTSAPLLRLVERWLREKP
jgi:CCR4-NOT complex subunit CAF16